METLSTQTTKEAVSRVNPAACAPAAEHRPATIWDFVDQVGVLDLESDELIKTLKVGNGHCGIAVIDTQTLKVVRHQAVDGNFPFWIAVPGNR